MARAKPQDLHVKILDAEGRIRPPRRSLRRLVDDALTLANKAVWESWDASEAADRPVGEVLHWELLQRHGSPSCPSQPWNSWVDPSPMQDVLDPGVPVSADPRWRRFARRVQLYDPLYARAAEWTTWRIALEWFVWRGWHVRQCRECRRWLLARDRRQQLCRVAECISKAAQQRTWRARQLERTRQCAARAAIAHLKHTPVR